MVFGELSMSPNTCPKFDNCSAPICPLDPDWHTRRMLRDERVCYYLLKVKDDQSLDGTEADAAREVLSSELLPYELKRVLAKG
jgi:hypothetical protein